MEEVYILLDDLRYDIYYASYKSTCESYERVLIKVFQDEKDKIVVDVNTIIGEPIETTNGIDKIVYDTRKDKTKDLMEYDLTFLKVLERMKCDREVKGMVYEKLPEIGDWKRVKLTRDAREKLKDEKLLSRKDMEDIWRKIFDR